VSTAEVVAPGTARTLLVDDPAGAAACAEGHRRYRVIFDALADRFGELA